MNAYSTIVKKCKNKILLILHSLRMRPVASATTENPRNIKNLFSLKLRKWYNASPAKKGIRIEIPETRYHTPSVLFYDYWESAVVPTEQEAGHGAEKSARTPFSISLPAPSIPTTTNVFSPESLIA